MGKRGTHSPPAGMLRRLQPQVKRQDRLRRGLNERLPRKSFTVPDFCEPHGRGSSARDPKISRSQKSEASAHGLRSNNLPPLIEQFDDANER